MLCWFSERNTARSRVASTRIKHTSKWARALVKDLHYRLDVNTLHRDEDGDVALAQRDRPRHAAHHAAAVLRRVPPQPRHRLVHPRRRSDERHPRRRHDPGPSRPRQVRGPWSTRLRRRGSVIRATTKRRGRRIRPTRSTGSSTSSTSGRAGACATSRRAPASSPGCSCRPAPTCSRSSRSPGCAATFRSAVPRRAAARGDRRGDAVPRRVARRGARRAGVALVRPRPRGRRDGAAIVRAGGGVGLIWNARDRGVAVGRRGLGDHGPRREARAVARSRELARSRVRGACPGSVRSRTAEFRHVQTLTPRPGRQRVASVSHVAVLPRGRARGRARRGAPCRRLATDDATRRPRLSSSSPTASTASRTGTLRDANRSLPAAAAAIELPAAGARRSSARWPAARRADAAAPARVGRERRPELVPGVRTARRALPRGRPRPARPRARPAHAPHLPPRRLRRRLRGDARRARHRPGHRGRLLDGRPGRAAALAPAPRPRLRAGAVRDGAPGSSRTRPPGLAYQTWMLGRAARRARRRAVAPSSPRIPFGRNDSRRLPAWVAAEMRRHDWRMIVEAGHSMSTYYAGRWIGEVDVPTAVVCTTEDRGVRRELQLAIADAIPGATVHRLADGHLACRATASSASPLLRARATTSPTASPRRSPDSAVDSRRTSAGASPAPSCAGTQPRTMPSQRVGIREREQDVPGDRRARSRSRTSRARTSRRCASDRRTARTSA